MKNNHNEILKVAAIGSMPFNYHLNLRIDDKTTLKLNLQDINNIKDAEKLFNNYIIKNKIYLNTNFFLFNLLIFINKTCTKNNFIEHITINNVDYVYFSYLSFIADFLEGNNLLIKPLNLYNDNFSFKLTIEEKDEKEEKVLKEEIKPMINLRKSYEGFNEIDKNSRYKQMVNDAFLYYNVKKSKLSMIDKINDKLSKLLLNSKICLMNCDEVFFDLNDFINNPYITLFDIYMYIVSTFEIKIIKVIT